MRALTGQLAMLALAGALVCPDSAIAQPNPLRQATDEESTNPLRDDRPARPAADTESSEPEPAADAFVEEPRSPARPESDSSQATADPPPAASADVLARLELDGVRPGVSTLAQVNAAWGEPIRAMKQGTVVHHLYTHDPFAQVQVTFYKDKVLSLIAQLPQPEPLADVTRGLALRQSTPALLLDPSGAVLGHAYPEHGILLKVLDGPRGEQPVVTDVVLEVIDAAPFVLRAQQQADREYTLALADLSRALELDPDCAGAAWLRARVLDSAGRLDDALRAAALAQRLEPEQADYQLTHARLLAQAGQFERAEAETRAALEGLEAPAADSAADASQRDLQAARGWIQLGEQVANGPRRDYQNSVDCYQQAIRRAEPWVADARPAVRREAVEALFEAHLASGHDIAWGHWRNKERVSARWFDRAEKLLEQAAEELGSSDAELRLCRRALAANVGLAATQDPAQWIQRARNVGEQRLALTGDPLRRGQLQWELGLALYDGVQAAHDRKEIEQALDWGAQAAAHLEQGAVGRQEAPGDAYMLGRLYYRLGSIYAADLRQHAQAIQWYDKAGPLLTQPVPDSALADVGRQGESLATMAVSYWSQGERPLAVKLTRHGVELMRQGVERGLLAPSRLRVAYANMATMHRRLGDDDQSDTYARLASQTEEVAPNGHVDSNVEFAAPR